MGLQDNNTEKIEQGLDFLPHFNAEGLITVISQDARTNQILMVAYMNKEALAETIKTGNAVFYSRSRKKLWRKGEQSGHSQKVIDILVDCDQDCLVLKVQADQGQCHVGYNSCFYRQLDKNNPEKLVLNAEKTYDPAETYKK